MLAAAALGGSVQVKGQLLRELLVESKAYGYLLGSGGAGEEGAGGCRVRGSWRVDVGMVRALGHCCCDSAFVIPCAIALDDSATVCLLPHWPASQPGVPACPPSCPPLQPARVAPWLALCPTQQREEQC